LLIRTMNGLGFERATQNRVLGLFQEKLGYRYLDTWKDRAGNSNIEEAILSATLQRRGYSEAEISGALYRLRIAADVSQVGLYEANRRVYSLLRYGVQVKTAADLPTSTVALIDWHNPEANDFTIAQEVTLKGNHERCPDLVFLCERHCHRRDRAQTQPRQSPRLVVESESHALWGQRLLLHIEEVNAASRIEVHPRHLVLFLRPGTTLEKRQELLAAWYRNELRQEAAGLIDHWQQRLGVQDEPPLHSGHEPPVGHLQSRHGEHPPEHAAGPEAPGLSRLHRGASARASAGANPWRLVPQTPRSAPPGLARTAPNAE